MALLKALAVGRRRAARGALGLVAALLVLSVTGCFVFEALGLREKPLAFSHRQHLEEGLDCTSCHSDYEDGDDVVAIKPAQCALCHEDLDADKVPERQVASLFDGNTFRAARVTALSAELRFSHSTHVATGAACDACHAGILQNDGVDRTVGPDMAACIQCHRATGQESGCLVCHTVIDTEHAPPNHALQWTTMHGVVVRGQLAGPANDCAMCHTEKTCNTCHQSQAPVSHNNTWRLQGHGVVASIDRDSCATCHTRSSCNRCHEDTQPLSHHSSTWGAPKDSHCFSCHFPLQSTNCFVCHKSTPSHAEAPPKPPDHSPASDCRECHVGPPSLFHVDNGDNCNFCHH